MAVITRYIVVRNGVELDKVFEDKKLAVAYDKMLDAAESLAAFIKQGDLKVDPNEKTIDEVCLYLAKNAPEVTQILKGIKPVAPKAPAPTKIEKPDEAQPAKEKKKPGRKPKAKAKRKEK